MPAVRSATETTVISVVEWLLQDPRESALPYEAIVILENFAATLQEVIDQTQIQHMVVASIGDLEPARLREAADRLRTRADAYAAAYERLLRELPPVVDNLERAIRERVGEKRQSEVNEATKKPAFARLSAAVKSPSGGSAIASAVSPSCVGAQISTRSPVTCAVQFCGSMVA